MGPDARQLSASCFESHAVGRLSYVTEDHESQHQLPSSLPVLICAASSAWGEDPGLRLLSAHTAISVSSSENEKEKALIKTP